MSVVYTYDYKTLPNQTPLNHARIGYDNHIDDTTTTVTASTEAAGFELDATQNPLTYDKWKPTALPATAKYDFGSAKTFGYIGIAAHTLGTEGATVVAEYSTDDISYTTLNVDTSPNDDSAIMLLFAEVSARYLRLTISGSTIPVIGVVYCGQVLSMYRPFYSGHTPGVLSRKTTIKPNKSVNGVWLGRSVIRSGLVADYSWQNTPIGWYESNFEPFVQHAIEKPFFVAWNPSEHADHVLYAWTSDDISPQLTGTLDLCEFGFSAEGVE
jgi:hypothetical protein